MGFVLYEPIKSIEAKTSSQPAHLQLWHELEILKFLPDGTGPEPYIRQGRIYFLDAWASNWRSAGLLYYYSFLNLAKAFLIKHNVFTIDQARTTNAYHGLSCKPQPVSSIVDLNVTVKVRNGKNVFAELYEKLVGEQWPFDEDIQIPMREILTFCPDISDELKRLFSIGQRYAQALSMIRVDGNGAWFEIVCKAETADTIASEISRSDYLLTVISPATVSPHDREQWLQSHRITAATLNQLKVIRSPRVEFSVPGTVGQGPAITECLRLARNNFNKHAFPASIHDKVTPHWMYAPKIKLGDRTILWHPLLSNYLVSFILGSVLRYQPHLVVDGTPDYFVAEAWIRQCPITFLRDFLISYDTPGVWILSV